MPINPLAPYCSSPKALRFSGNSALFPIVEDMKRKTYGENVGDALVFSTQSGLAAAGVALVGSALYDGLQNGAEGCTYGTVCDVTAHDYAVATAYGAGIFGGLPLAAALIMATVLQTAKRLKNGPTPKRPK